MIDKPLMRRVAATIAGVGLLATPLAAQDAKNGPLSVSTHLNKGVATPPPPPPPVVQDYDPKPAMWTMRDADTVIHLFGTYHILPNGFRWRTAAIDRAVAEADELVVETSDKDSDAQLEAFGPDLLASMIGRPATSTRLAPENRVKWRKLASHLGIGFEAFDTMPALFAMLSAGLSVSSMGGSTHDFGVETYLEEEFAKSGRPVGSIENGGAVMRALLAIDETKLIAQLDKDLSEWDGETAGDLFDAEIDDTDIYASEHSWAKGELTPVFTQEDLAQPAFQELNQVLMIDRNRAWADWLKARLDRPGNVLVAVGAGHFDGKDSVIAMLERQGLSAERVQ